MLANSLDLTQPKFAGEQRITLRGLDWLAYQQMQNLLTERTKARLTYDRGTLEITMPSQSHEFGAEIIGLFIRILVVEMGLKLLSLRSTTLDRSDLNRGAEPDNSYYIGHQPQVAGREIDLETDPPPDLVVEVDIAHTDIDKPALYAAMGVPEFWRFDGKVWQIFQLEAGQYLDCDTSPLFPFVSKADLYQFLAACQQDEVAAEIKFRAWVREELCRE
jgi:Uma2 family endonuclease